jgi:hypothetical protein
VALVFVWKIWVFGKDRSLNRFMKRLLIFAAAVRFARTAIQLRAQDSEAVREPPSTKVTSTITRNQWSFDTLDVYGTLTNVNVTLKVIGFDKTIVTESGDYAIQPEGLSALG